MTPLLGFSTPPQIPHNTTSERPPMITIVFVATTPKNTPFAYHASTSANPNPMITLAFVEDYDEEQEMEPRPKPNHKVTPILRLRSPTVRRQRERVVGFEEAPNREGSRGERNSKGSRPSEIETRENGNEGVNFPPLLEALLGRNGSGQPLRSYLTSVYGGHQPSTNIGGNLPPNGTFLSHHAQPFISSSWHTPTGLVPTHVNSYSHPSAGTVNGQTLNFPFQTQTSNPSLGEPSPVIQQRISGFVHGLRTKSLVEHLSTDLPSTYKGLVEKTYTWIEAREVATNETPNDRRENFNRLRKSSWDNNRRQKGRDRFSPYRGPNDELLSSLSKSKRKTLATEKAARRFEQPPRILGSRRSRDMSKYCHFHKDHGHDTNDCLQLINKIEEAVKSWQLSHLMKGIKKERKSKGLREPANKREKRQRHYAS
nr:hypothetical protein [Tanacetum cinerariifolium]